MDYIKVTLLFVIVMFFVAACSVFVQNQRQVCGSKQHSESVNKVDSTKFNLKVEKYEND